MKNIFKYLAIFLIGVIIAIAIVEYREARNEAMHRRLMCASVDIRLVKSGMVNCEGVETAVYK